MIVYFVIEICLTSAHFEIGNFSLEIDFDEFNYSEKLELSF